MRPRGSVWLSARKPPDITGVALTLQIRPRRPRQQARGGPGRPGLPRQHRQRARPGPKTQTPGVPPRPLLPLGAAGPWVGGGGDSLQVSSSLRPARSCDMRVLRLPPSRAPPPSTFSSTCPPPIPCLVNYSTHTSQRSAPVPRPTQKPFPHMFSPRSRADMTAAAAPLAPNGQLPAPPRNKRVNTPNEENVSQARGDATLAGAADTRPQ